MYVLFLPVCVFVAQSCPTLCDPMDCTAHQALGSMGFSRQGYWSGLPLPSPDSLVTQMINNPPAMWETWVQSLG